MKCLVKLLVLLAPLFYGAVVHAMPLFLQPIQVCDDSGGVCAAANYFQDETKKIWAQAGIEINFLDVAQIHDSDLLNVSTDGHPGSAGAPSFFDLLNAGKVAVNDWELSGIINLFFTQALNEWIDEPDTFAAYGWACGANSDPTLGFSATPACTSSPAVFVSERVFNETRTDTIAHELGHTLGLFHTNLDPAFPTNPPDNLMTAGGDGRIPPMSVADIYPDGAQLSKLTAGQIQTALASDLLTKQVVLPTLIPAPPTTVLIGLGLIILRIRKSAFPII